MKTSDYSTFNAILSLSCAVFIVLFTVVCTRACAHECHQRTSDLLALEFQVAVGHQWCSEPAWVTPGCSAVPPGPLLGFLPLAHQQQLIRVWAGKNTGTRVDERELCAVSNVSSGHCVRVDFYLGFQLIGLGAYGAHEASLNFHQRT